MTRVTDWEAQRGLTHREAQMPSTLLRLGSEQNDITRPMPPDPEAAKMARDMITEAYRTWGLNPTSDMAYIARTVMSELATNALERDAVFVVRLLRSHTAPIIEVWDPSPELPIKQLPDGLAEGGRGMYVIHDLAVRVVYEWIKGVPGKFVRVHLA